MDDELKAKLIAQYADLHEKSHHDGIHLEWSDDHAYYEAYAEGFADGIELATGFDVSNAWYEQRKEQV